MNGATARQLQILDFIRTYIADHGWPPTLIEIGAQFGFNKNAARDHLRYLKNKGLIQIDFATSRGIKILGAPTPEVAHIGGVSSLDIKRPRGATPLLGKIVIPVYTPASLAAAVRDGTFLAAHAFPRNQDRPVPYAVAQKDDAPTGRVEASEVTNSASETNVTGGSPGEPH